MARGVPSGGAATTRCRHTLQTLVEGMVMAVAEGEVVATGGVMEVAAPPQTVWVRAGAVAPVKTVVAVVLGMVGVVAMVGMVAMAWQWEVQ